MLFFKKSGSTPYVDQLNSINKEIISLIISWQKSSGALLTQLVISAPAIFESLYMILLSSFGITETKQQKVIRLALFLLKSIILILILHPQNLDLILFSILNRVYQILEALTNQLDNCSVEEPNKGNKKRLRKNKRNLR